MTTAALVLVLAFLWMLTGGRHGRRPTGQRSTTKKGA